MNALRAGQGRVTGEGHGNKRLGIEGSRVEKFRANVFINEKGFCGHAFRGTGTRTREGCVGLGGVNAGKGFHGNKWMWGQT